MIDMEKMQLEQIPAHQIYTAAHQQEACEILCNLMKHLA